MASRRRSATVPSLTRTAIGSRPITPSCRTSIDGAFGETEFDQPALEFAARQIGCVVGPAMASMRPRNPLRANPKGAVVYIRCSRS